VIDEATARPKLDANGEPIRRGRRQTVRCEACPKDGWTGFTEHNQVVFEICRASIETGSLPRAGGVEDQEPRSMETLLLLKRIKERCGADAAGRDQDALLKRLFG